MIHEKPKLTLDQSALFLSRISYNDRKGLYLITTVPTKAAHKIFTRENPRLMFKLLLHVGVLFTKVQKFYVF